MENLNEKQKEAVLQTQGPLLIVAGAGAGKTKTIIERMINLIENNVKAENILGITFTNKAAKEMKDRIEAKLPNQTLPTLKTFHSLSVKIIRENGESFGLSKNFSILDEDESIKRIKSSLKNLGFDPKEIRVEKIKKIISKAKQDLLTPEMLEKELKNNLKEITPAVWRDYEKECQKDKVLDFDDLLVYCYKILSRPDIRDKYHNIYKYIHVDEYQDTNNLEYNIVRLLVGPQKNICVVGDADQNIYSWRGSKIENILRFEKDWPEAKIIFLEENYRSTKTILELANKAIEKNTLRIPKILTTQNKKGDKAHYALLYNETNEAHYVANKCLELISSGCMPENIAILYRANFQSRAIEEAMISNNVPYTVLGTRFFERKEVKDLISYLKASLDKTVIGEIKRIINTPPRGLGKLAVLKIFSNQSESLTPKNKQALISFYKILDDINIFMQKNPPSKTVKYAIDRSGLRQDLEDKTEENMRRIENMEELATIAFRFDYLGNQDGMLAFLDEVSLHNDQDDMEKGKGVRLMTVHASKGLEFENVFIVGLEEGLFPHERIYTSSKIDEAEEERRLFYVALTRAKKKIFMTSAQIRTIFGNKETRIPSEFLSDLPSELIQYENETDFDNKQNKDIYII